MFIEYRGENATEVIERNRDSAEVSDEENSYWRWVRELKKQKLQELHERKFGGKQKEGETTKSNSLRGILLIVCIFIVLIIILVIEETAPISFPDLTSAGNCHVECNGGCTESNSATSCFACKHLTQTLRNKGGSGFKCVQKCDDTYYLDGDKCKMCSSHCHTCTKAEVCETCPGSLLLIEVDNMPHYDHGKCVESCPPGLVADYETNLVQARCIWRKDLCGNGYYINAVGKCDLCDSACETCIAPGPMSCEKCANGYGKGSIGYCRPCCAPGSGKDWHCEDCSTQPPEPSESSDSGYGWFFWITVVALFGLGFWSCWKCVAANSSAANIEYAPLPHYNATNGEVNLGVNSDEDDDEDEDELFTHLPASQNV
ncbi:unnamed protein product [Caenorhabditis sp. 36 PRJEB53466]|nr:unnamed protein product [Caenorhabditis sp. 36 PRJEB53466]